MFKSRAHRIAVLLLCLGFSVLTALLFNYQFRSSYGGTARPDFAAIYYGARCVIHRQDPYHPEDFLRVFRAEGGTFSTDEVGRWVGPIAVAVEINLPTTLYLVTPLALLPFAIAQAAWLLVTIVLLVIAGYLTWSIADTAGPAISGCLIGIVMANCQEILMLGNVAGIAVSLCVIATWCFVKNRYILAAVVFFAVSLAIKPHDVGFVWLFFLLTRGDMRRRALQTLAVTAVIGIVAAIWIAPASPHWLHELRANHIVGSELGSVNDPSPSGVTSGNPGAILDLQALFSVVWDDPHFYNLASYLVTGLLIGVWAWTTIRRRNTADGVWLALASIAALSLLPVYHRPHDAKLLLLTIPACARLWRQGGARRWLCFGFTSLAILFTSDIFMGLLTCLSRRPPFGRVVPGEKATAVFLLPPALLLATAGFYLWMLVRDSSEKLVAADSHSADDRVSVSTAMEPALAASGEAQAV